MKMKKFFHSFKSLIYCIFELIVGILIFINPHTFTSGIVTVMGIVLTVIGVLCVMGYFRMSPEMGAMSSELTKGLVLLCAGVFCIIKPDWFEDIFPVVAVIYGVAILISGLVKLQWVVDSIRMRQKDWAVPALGAGTSIILAIIILINPFVSVSVMWAFVGAVLIIEAVIDGISAVGDLKKRGKSGDSDDDSDSECKIEIEDA